MKKLLLELLVFLPIFAANAQTGSGEAPSLNEFDRKLVFTIGPKDALKCGNQILGNHLRSASVYRVTFLNNNNSYFEIDDQFSYAAKCEEEQVQKLTGYFDSIQGTVKYKTVARVFQPNNTVFRETEMRCEYDNENVSTDASLKTRFVVVKKIFGEKPRTPYFDNEIVTVLFDDKNVRIASCDRYELNSNGGGESLAYGNKDVFEREKQDIVDKTNWSGHQSVYLAGCMAKFNWDTFSISTKFLLNRSKELFKFKGSLTQDERRELFIKHVTQENCMLKL